MRTSLPGLSALRWKVGRVHLEAIRMKRPVVGRVDLAELLLSLLFGVAIVSRVQLHCSLANLAHVAVFAEHIFDESDEIARH